jgi:8-oxo-dGTP pyrophosphatase MutT (NUDIX family)
MAKLSVIYEKLATHARDPGVAVPGPAAAVAAILREQSDAASAELLFIRRAEHPKDPWSGHVAFPGGRRDPEDETLLATAIRETREEIGVDLSPENLLARLPDVQAMARSGIQNLIVTPFVFSVGRDVALQPNAEVADTLWVPMDSLVRGDGKSSFSLEFRGQNYELPCIHLEPGKHRLWGMTFRMLEMLLEALA